jgi:hypothetical protein
MTIHKFDFNLGQEQLIDYVNEPKDNLKPKTKDLGDPGDYDTRDELYYNKQGDDEGGIPLGTQGQVEDTINVNYVEEVRETYINGFGFVDRAIKNYFSGIRVPSGQHGTEQHKMVPVKIAGGDASTLIYADEDIRGGRLKLPIIAITRTGHNFDEKRFSPAYLNWFKRHKNNGRRMEINSRPTPYNVDYTIDIWAEYKHDVEFINYAITSRFNPVASFYLTDISDITYELFLKFNSGTDNSELETDAETRGKRLYQINIQAEAWLPLPSRIIPTILSNPMSVKEGFLGCDGQIKFPGETYFVKRD